MADEEFHEIQLNGKQLVFLFMAGTVAAVVIFLCGLMVGRNLHVPRLEAAAATSETTVGDPTRPADSALPPPADSNTGGPPVTIKENLTYSGRLEDPTPVEETLTDVPARGKGEKGSPAKLAPEKAAVKPPKATATATVTDGAAPANPEPRGNGWAVQVQAVTTRAEADALARRLSAKGYPAFVTPRGSGPLVRYGVRVGKYDKKGEAEAVKARLEKEEQFKPWVTK